MRLDDPSGNGKPKPGAGRTKRSRCRPAVETFEDVRAVFLSDADARVRDLDLGVETLTGKARSHGATRGGITPGVVEHDQKQLFETVAVALDDDGFDRVDLHLDMRGGRTGLADGLEQHRVQLHGSHLESGTGFRPSKREKVADQAR